MSWAPVLTDPAQRARASRLVERLAGVFDLDPPPPRLERFRQRALGIDGVPAAAMLFAHLALGRDDERDLPAVSAWLDRGAHLLATLEEPTPWLESGLAGSAFGLVHVCRSLSGDGAVGDATEDLDQLLIESLDAAAGADAEFAQGTSGLGVYFLEALTESDRAEHGLARVVERLAEQVVQRPEGFAWRKTTAALSADERLEHPSGLFNLSIPHGVPGIVSFLAGAAGVGRSGAVARELLEGAVSWLLAQATPVGSTSFGYLVDVDRGPIPAESRLAWCYGDLAIGAVLLRAARCTGRADWERRGTELALAAARRPFEGSGVEDGVFCHGAVGVAHLFARTFHATGCDALRQAAVRWFERTLDLDDPDGSPTGYRCQLADPPGERGAPVVFAESYGLTSGAAGLALALWAALGDRPFGWDRALGVEIPGRGR